MESYAAIHILCTKISPRLNFVVDYLSHVTGITLKTVTSNFSVLNDEQPDQNKKTLNIHYSDIPVNGAFTIYAGGLLTETGIRQQEPAVLKQSGQTLIFPAPPGFGLPLDLFSAIFYQLSRYEEYLTFKPDRYGRFEADQSLALRNGFLEEPVVDQWVELFRKALTVRFPEMVFPVQKFGFISTIDVDSPWAYLNKGFWRTAGGFAKEIFKLNIPELRRRLHVLKGKSNDPFDNFDYIKETEHVIGFQSLFFFLSGNYGGFDVNYALGTIQFSDLLSRVKAERSVGIHPSFRSSRNSRFLKPEFEYFSHLLGRKPEISRQHFLMLTFPQTYRQLLSFGIQTDYSMGYASLPGFRAGTSKPFRFYDLMNEYETRLLIHPFAVMDVTLKQYLNLNPEAAQEKISKLIGKTRAVNGIFTCLWHNESLSDRGMWKGWRWVWEGMVREGMRKG